MNEPNINYDIPNNLIFKACILDETGEINKIILFQGNQEYNYIFNDDELLIIKEKDIQIIKSHQQIHKDDSIHLIKKKILNELDYNIVMYEELYLYSKTDDDIDLQIIYNNITDNGKISFTYDMLYQILLNLNIKEESLQQTIIEKIQKGSKIYSLNDFLNIFNDIKNTNFSKPIGYNFINYFDYLFSGNPYNILNKSKPIFTMKNNNYLIQIENNVLLNYNITNNNIYVCTATNVLQNYGTDINEYIIELYFPLLKKYEIYNNEMLNNKRQMLISNNKENIRINNVQNNINLLHNIYYTTKDNIPNLSSGIKNIHFIIHPSHNITIPLEFIFKLIHCSKDVLYIKYNPGFQREHMYRLYSESVAKNGKKIPFLTKNRIMNLSKISGKTKQISIYFDIPSESVNYFFIDIESNGNIVVRFDLEETINEFDLNILLLDKVNTIIDQINRIIQIAGYKMNNFMNLNSPNIEIININYEWKTNYKKILKMEKYVNLFKGVFNVHDNNSIIYKRVEKYSDLDEITAVIAQTYKQNNDINYLKKILMTNFSLSESDTESKIKKFLNEHTYINGNYVNKSVSVIVNPGIPCTIKEQAFTNNIILTAFNITSIDYIHTLNIYMHVLILISQYSELSSINFNDILKNTNKLNEIIEDIEPIIIPENVISYSFNDAQSNLISDDKFFSDSDNDSDSDSESDTNSDSNSDWGDSNMSAGGYTKFLKKMKKLEPTLFKVSTKDGNFDSYTRACPANLSRQPIILTDDEKKDIDNKYPNSYKSALQYSSQPDKKFWYICPRYWCLKPGENRPLTEEDVKNGECNGKIIPKNATNIPEGHYIYEFSSKEHKNADGSYRHHYPGFVPTNKHKTNCLPCCFKNLYSEQQISRREECNISQDDLVGDLDTIKNKEMSDDLKKQTKEKKQPKNILEFNKYPINENRWGQLPLSISTFLNISNNTKDNIKLLRYGVNNNSPNQSFLYCLADIYSITKKYSIQDLRKKIISLINLDTFTTLQNGSLISIFNSNLKVNIEKYKNSSTYKKMDLTKSPQKQYLTNVISSYENFIDFLNDKDSFIDYTYLWDIVTSKKIGLFDKNNDTNLVILEIVNNDITDNIHLLCPTNSHRKHLFDITLNTIILVKHDDFFEPLYLYGNTISNNLMDKNIDYNAVKMFNQHNIPVTLKNMLLQIESVTNSYCKSIPTNIKLYEFEQPLPANIIYDLLQLHNYIILFQILNYNGKVIGFAVKIREEDESYVYVPTNYSNNIHNLNTIFIDDVEWIDYHTTIERLNSISDKVKQIKCKPIIKVSEDGLIVGFLTQTNQFILVNDLQQNIDDDLKTIEVSNYKDYYNIDKSLNLSNNIDQERISAIQNISLEYNFYLAFRNKIRLLLNEYYNIEVYNKITHIINDKKYLYNNKIDKLTILLKYLTRNHVIFSTIDDDVLNDIYEIKLFNHNKEKNGFCLENDKYSLCIPEDNLINQQLKNEVVYYTRLADELIRFNRIQLFMLNKNEFINITETDFNVNDNELFIIQSILFDNYFENLKPKNNNKYVSNITYDNAIPNNVSNAIIKSNKIEL